MIWSVQLVFDCADPFDVMLFWGHTLQHPWLLSMDKAGLQEWIKGYPQYEGRGRIDDDANAQIPIYIQRVPEPKVGRNRVRFDLGAPDVAGTRNVVEALGASSSNGEMRDPEGNEFAIVQAPSLAIRTIAIDALDPDRLLEFWRVATEYDERDGRLEPRRGEVEMKDGWLVADGKQIWEPWWPNKADRELYPLAPAITFVKTDEPKGHKNRLHLDIRSTDAEVHRDRLVDLGASVVEWEGEHVMQDPEGNEFCIG